MGINTAPLNASLKNNTSQADLTFINSLYTQSGSSTAKTHKSFDFSNVNVSSSPYKQYHQTRIYVKNYNEMTTGGANLGSNNTYIISSNLPDNFNYAIGSDWVNPIGDIFAKTGNLILQMAGGFLRNSSDSTFRNVGDNLSSGVNRAASFLIWNGSKPLEIQLKIPVIDDNSANSNDGTVRTNLKEALEFLGCLCLPTLRGSLGFYTPAPSPMRIDVSYGGINEKTKKANRNLIFSPNEARIMVQIGGILFIDNCIIKSVNVSYPNTKSLMLRDDGTLSPVLAEVTIHITTIEALTSDTYTKMLWLNQQSDQGKGSLDLNAIYDTFSKASDELGKFVSGLPVVKDIKNVLGMSDNTNVEVNSQKSAGGMLSGK